MVKCAPVQQTCTANLYSKNLYEKAFFVYRPTAGVLTLHYPDLESSYAYARVYSFYLPSRSEESSHPLICLS
jgi:hypothetical protein